MFTGIVTTVGRVLSARSSDGGSRIALSHDLPGEAVVSGESVAVDGCCLTALAPAAGRFEADLTPETLSRTGGLRAWNQGKQVNLERSLRAGDRMGGHIVQGHVDGRRPVCGFDRLPDGSALLRVALPSPERGLVVEKGSVAVSGVSLTVARVGDEWYEIALIPATLTLTTLGRLSSGDEVNIEYDVLAKYAARAVGRELAAPS